MRRFKKYQVKIFLCWIAVCAFLALLWLPLFQLTFKAFPETQNAEKRQLAVKPILIDFSLKSISQYALDYEQYFNDNFGFRNFLVSGYSGVKIKLFKVSPLEKVVIGRNNWLYYNDPHDGENLSDYSGRAPLSDTNLRIIEEQNRQRIEWFSQRGIKLLIVIPPNKHSVYPDNLPISVPDAGENRMSQIMKSEINRQVILDLKPSLLEAKKHLPVYYKTDTHWNKYGAYVGYRQIMSRLYPDEQTPDQSDRFRVTSKKSPGDLAMMISAENLFDDNEVSAEELNFVRKNAKIMVFHDSFGTLLDPYLAQSFEEADFIKSPVLDYEMIEREKPQIVIWELVERYSAGMQED